MQPLTRKYQPRFCKEIIGHEPALKELRNFITNFKMQKKKAALAYGPSGTGKTCAVYTLANEFGLEVYEINASDTRNKEQIEQKLGNAIKQQSLFSKGKIILVDEIDGLAGAEDRGGVKTIAEIINKTSFPVIMTCINPWNDKLSTIRSRSAMVKFEHLSHGSIHHILENICIKEKLSFEKDVLSALSGRSGGDARAAINNLQTLATREITREEVNGLSDSDRQDTIINALLKILKTTDPKVAISALENVDEDLNDVMLWIDENLPKEYEKPEDLARAYDKLSKADVFNRRIKRWQHWRFLVYINALLTVGIALSKDEKYKRFIKYNPPSRILKLWWAKQKSMKKKAIALKIAEKTHASSKNVLKDIDYFRVIFKKNKEMASEIAEEMDLDNEEVEWLRK